MLVTKLINDAALIVTSGHLISLIIMASSCHSVGKKNELLEDFISKYCRTSDLSKDDITKLRYQAILFEKPLSEKKKLKKPKKLTNRQKIIKSIGEIPNESITYSTFTPMNKLWKEYTAEVLGNVPKTPTHGQTMSLCQKLVKLDYHGCIITVLDSKCSSYVGHTGIVMRETQNTFTIVNANDKRKTIPKRNNIFAFKFSGMMFKLYGNNFRIRPSLRCSKRFKDKTTTDFD